MVEFVEAGGRLRHLGVVEMVQASANDKTDQHKHQHNGREGGEHLARVVEVHTLRLAQYAQKLAIGNQKVVIDQLFSFGGVAEGMADEIDFLGKYQQIKSYFKKINF